MIVSNRVEIAVNKVLNGYMSYFDFIVEFSDINTVELASVLLIEVKTMYQTAFMYHSLDYAYDEDGNIVDPLETFEPYYPIHIETLKTIIEHYERLCLNETHNNSVVDIDTTLIEKVLYLHYLGVIDFLRQSYPFNTSTNKLAIIIGAITGGRTSSTQPLLNPMINEHVDQSKNPLTSSKPVEKVRQMLIEIGYKID